MLATLLTWNPGGTEENGKILQPTLVKQNPALISDTAKNCVARLSSSYRT